MIAFDPIPEPIQLTSSLAEVGRTGNAERLREYLRGRYLPALGGDLTPAEILEAALQHSPEIGRSLSRPLARILLEEGKDLSAVSGNPSAQDMLRNALTLAAILPTDATLSSSLAMLHGRMQAHRESEELQKLLLPLWQALVCHQIDASLEMTWLEVLGSDRLAQTAEGRTLLFTAWRGLLWIPLSQPGEQVPIVNFDLVNRGLLILHSLFIQHAEGANWLCYALEILAETYPRSRSFWEHHFGQQFHQWPPLLQKSALQMWPGLDRTSIPADAPSVHEMPWETILVVEDEENIRRPLAQILKSSGYNVLEAADGAQALEISQRHSGPIHLMVTDILMGGMSGVELAEKLSFARAEMKVLFATGYPAGLEGEDANLIKKPFTGKDLATKVQEVLESAD